jgi:hypothetical protein
MTPEPKYGDLAIKLWDVTHTDWHVSIEHVLTEPVCCSVSLTPDDDKWQKLDGFIGTYDVNESIANAIEHLLPKLGLKP